MKNCDILFPDTPFSEREYMKRKELFSKYKIKKIPYGYPPGFRWECRKDGKRYRFTDCHYDDMIRFLEEDDSFTLQDVFEDFITYSQDVLDLKPGTIKSYRDAWKYISIHRLSEMPVKAIKTSDINEFFIFVKSSHNGIKRRYWDNIKGTLSSCVDYCILVKDLSAVNLFKHYVPKGKNPFEITEKRDSSTRWFSDPEEREQLIRELNRRARDLQDPRYLGIALLFYTGMRIGELTALKWTDIQDDFISIHRQAIKSGSEEIVVDHCKTSSSVRRIRLNRDAIDLLKTVKKMYMIKGLSSEYIFLDLIGKRCQRHQLDKKLRKVQKALGFTEIRSCHDIRRTYINVLFYSGVNVKKIQSLVGHSTLKQTQDYICIGDTDDDDLIDKALNF